MRSDDIAQAEGSDRRRSFRGAGEESVRLRLRGKSECKEKINEKSLKIKVEGVIIDNLETGA